MAVYKLSGNELIPLETTSFEREGLREHNDLQRLLRSKISFLAPDTLLIAEEFGDWDEGRRRIDLLAFDKKANLVVIELKRDETGAHMDLQAIRYAAMVSTMTFERAIAAHAGYLQRIDDKIVLDTSKATGRSCCETRQAHRPLNGKQASYSVRSIFSCTCHLVLP